MAPVTLAPERGATAPRSNAAIKDLAVALAAAMEGEVDTATRRLAEYSTDASNYRVVPSVVAFPRHADDVVTAHRLAREAGIPVTMRGGGTSVAGNAIGTGLVLDTSRHMNGLLAVDVEAKTARVQPGLVLSTLQGAVAKHGLRFGPDPSTSTRATFGGLIGNNACGPHAVAFGRTADNVVELDVIDGSGRHCFLFLFQIPNPRSNPCPSTRRRCATCNSSCTKFSR